MNFGGKARRGRVVGWRVLKNGLGRKWLLQVWTLATVSSQKSVIGVSFVRRNVAGMGGGAVLGGPLFGVVTEGAGFKSGRLCWAVLTFVGKSCLLCVRVIVCN